MSFDINDFVDECRRARREPDAAEQIAALLRSRLSDPAAIAEAVAARQAGVSPPPMAEVFVNDEDLTVYHLALPPNLYGVPHDHAGWAVIGVYEGAEAFDIYEERGGRLERVGRQELEAPCVRILPPDLIHDIQSIRTTPSGSIHVYSNRHFDMPSRRIWRDSLAESEPFSVAKSYEFGMALTLQRRKALGIEDDSAPALPGGVGLKAQPARC